MNQEQIDQEQNDAEAESKTPKTWQRPKAKGVVTQRDAVACQWVCEQGAMTIEQLWRAVWWSKGSNSPRYAYVRVLFLERAGFLEKIRSPYSLKSFYKATRAAQELAASRGGALPLIPLQAPPINEIPHVDVLTEVRLTVTRADKLKSWKTDRVLAVDPTFPRERFYSHVPDAIWTTPSGKRIAVEYERTRKGLFRIRQKVEAFSREIVRPDRAFERVLWIGATGTMGDLTKALSNHPSHTLRKFEAFKSELTAEAPPLGGKQEE